MKPRFALLACAVLLAQPGLAVARQSAAALARKAAKDAAADPAHWFATRQGLLRVYQERDADKKNAAQMSAGDNAAPADASSAAPSAGASCEVIESTPKDGETAARTRESCTMISGRKPKGGTVLTYELRDRGIYMVEAKAEGPAEPVKLDRLLLPAPARKGKSWSEERGSTHLVRTVKSAGKACKTADRTFGDCLVLAVVEEYRGACAAGRAACAAEKRRKHRAYTEIYAAGVGLVEDAQWELIDVKGL
jgi:hypothetical protein